MNQNKLDVSNTADLMLNNRTTVNKEQTQQSSSLQTKPKGQENIVQQLQNEINELKQKTENLEKDYKTKFQNLGVALSIDDDIEKLLYMKKDKKWMELNDQRKAVDRHEN